MQPILKAPGSERLKLEHQELLSKFAFNFNLRRYTPLFSALSDAVSRDDAFMRETLKDVIKTDDYIARLWAIYEAGAYTRSHWSSTSATPGHTHELILVIRWTEELKLS